jgi:acyl-CoA synthetase (AMP-forming)/AMP-acid ligase II
MLTHRNLANMLQVDRASHYAHDADTTIAFLPSFHIYGLTVIALLGVWSGATLVVTANSSSSRISICHLKRASATAVAPRSTADPRPRRPASAGGRHYRDVVGTRRHCSAL